MSEVTRILASHLPKPSQISQSNFTPRVIAVLIGTYSHTNVTDLIFYLLILICACSLPMFDSRLPLLYCMGKPFPIEMIDAIEIALWDAAAAQSNLPVK